ncbi:hypothetical protein GOODEAATRI_016952 [Goodea atripinnis]|uniref:Uncharacterized protein n=1 Tax=Goodea atripinnis TaxID=208336 RepID=A0ABV0NPA8_9TELE
MLEKKAMFTVSTPIHPKGVHQVQVRILCRPVQFFHTNSLSMSMSLCTEGYARLLPNSPTPSSSLNRTLHLAQCCSPCSCQTQTDPLDYQTERQVSSLQIPVV